MIFFEFCLFVSAAVPLRQRNAGRKKDPESMIPGPL